MEIKSIPTEIVIALISGVYGLLILLWSKMDQIWKAISLIQKDYVEHEVCAERRKQCPCQKEYERKLEHESRKNRKI